MMAPNSRRDLLARYVLEHRTAIVAAGFLLLADQILSDWLAFRWASGAEFLASVGGPKGGLASITALVALVAGLILVGARGLRWRIGRIRVATAPGRSGFAAELFVFAGALAVLVNLFVRGTAAAPLVIVSLPAAMVLLFEPRKRDTHRAEPSPLNLGGTDHA